MTALARPTLLQLGNGVCVCVCVVLGGCRYYLGMVPEFRFENGGCRWLIEGSVHCANNSVNAVPAASRALFRHTLARTHTGCLTVGKTQAHPLHTDVLPVAPYECPVFLLFCFFLRSGTPVPSSECPAIQPCPCRQRNTSYVAGNPQFRNLSTPGVGLTNMGRAAGMWPTNERTHARTHTLTAIVHPLLLLLLLLNLFC